MSHRHDNESAGDEALRRALRALPADDHSAAVDALTARVLTQWQQRQDPVADARRNGKAAALGARLWRRRLWLGTAGLAAAAAIATTLLVTRPDPSLDELMQPDVLSQMAIGEM